MDYQQIGGYAFAAIILMILLGTTLPILMAFIWIRKTKQPIVPMFVGAGVFFLFAMVLETFPKLILFQNNNPVGAFVVERTWLFGLIAAFLAGLFEETGRFVAFKYWLKKYTDKKTAITYGIGHGGFEAIFLLIGNGIQNLVFAVLINTGNFNKIIEQAEQSAPDQLEAVKAIPAALAVIGIGTVLWGILERISAVTFHIACSMLVFAAARDNKKRFLYPAAIVSHTLIDIIAVEYQFGGITSTAAVECFLFVAAAVLFCAAYKFVYKKIQ